MSVLYWKKGTKYIINVSLPASQSKTYNKGDGNLSHMEVWAAKRISSLNNKEKMADMK